MVLPGPLSRRHWSPTFGFLVNAIFCFGAYPIILWSRNILQFAAYQSLSSSFILSDAPLSGNPRSVCRGFSLRLLDLSLDTFVAGGLVQHYLARGWNKEVQATKIPNLRTFLIFQSNIQMMSLNSDELGSPLVTRWTMSSNVQVQSIYSNNLSLMSTLISISSITLAYRIVYYRKLHQELNSMYSNVIHVGWPLALQKCKFLNLKKKTFNCKVDKEMNFITGGFY